MDKKMILIAYDEYLELTSNANNGEMLLNNLKECIDIKNEYGIELGESVPVLYINSEKLKEILKRHYKVDKINIIK